MAKTKFTKKPVQSEDGSEWRCGSKRREAWGRRRWTIVEEKGRPKGVGPKWPETAGQDMDDSMIPRPYGVQERIRDIKELGIEEDVNDILYYIELGDFTKQALPAYREPAIEFLASLKLKKHPQGAAAELKRDGMATSPSLYWDKTATELHALWRMISSRSYQISSNKSGCIKNPAIRYAHKSCLYEQGKIKESHLAIGSLITPILLATKVKLPAPSHPPKFIDIAHLNKTGSCVECMMGSTSIASSIPRLASQRSFFRTPILQTPTAGMESCFSPRLISCLWMEAMQRSGSKGVNEESLPQGQASELGEFDFIPYNASGSVRDHQGTRAYRHASKSPKATKAASPSKTVEPTLRRSKRKRKTGASPPPTSSTEPIDLDDCPTPPYPDNE
ncbi:unnamed protein product [Microthlaspi erraticum]|uniref:Arabidopsis retrotransposon Orf1 C-terminal domain-containing protein n=1 Tax=Microthlaspi erraticum TaxID=1685480 RepID=A0A6D2I6W4_9BRAS|nr:unnamed protein product [Microthlaspi erraticum]